MASPSLCLEFETNLMSNRKVIELVVQLKSAKVHGKKYIKVKPHLVGHLLGNRPFPQLLSTRTETFGMMDVVSGSGEKCNCFLLF